MGSAMLIQFWSGLHITGRETKKRSPWAQVDQTRHLVSDPILDEQHELWRHGYSVSKWHMRWLKPNLTYVLGYFVVFQQRGEHIKDISYIWICLQFVLITLNKLQTHFKYFRQVSTILKLCGHHTHMTTAQPHKATHKHCLFFWQSISFKNVHYIWFNHVSIQYP